eukprot:gene5070-5732_t
MEQTGHLDIENEVHLFALHSAFLPRINNALKEWMASFNNHPLSTEKCQSPNQLWIKGMMDPNNTLANNETEDDAVDTFYGKDLLGPQPFQQSDNCVIVSPVILPETNIDKLIEKVAARADCLQESPNFGMDIFFQVLRSVYERLHH